MPSSNISSLEESLTYQKSKSILPLPVSNMKFNSAPLAVEPAWYSIDTPTVLFSNNNTAPFMS